MPSLNDYAIDKFVLVCCIASQSTDDQGLRGWLESEEGMDFYEQSLMSIRESQSLELKALIITALLWHSRILDPEPDGHLVAGCGLYLWDFDELLYAKPVRNPQVVWETMACSIRRAAGGECHPLVREYLDAAAEPPIIWTDFWTDRYWFHSPHRQHTDAWKEVLREYELACLSSRSSRNRSGCDSIV